MEKINVAELLKDCPGGMKLDCTIYEDVVFHDIVDRHYPIRVRRKQGGLINLNAYGCMDDKIDSKCVIFPKGKTTWEEFQRPFKKGDIVVNNSNERSNPFIYKDKNKEYYECYVGLTVGSNPILVRGSSDWVDISCELRFATEEEKQFLFDSINESGYEWNSDTKTLEEFSEFKEGDVVFSGVSLISILKKRLSPSKSLHTYVSIDESGKLYINENGWIDQNLRLATEEEKQKLFQAIKANGYRWNAKTKTLERLVTSFKKGDIVVNNSSKRPFIYKGKNKDYYECYVGLTVGFNLVKECSTWIDISCELRPATEEEKQKLFQAIKDNGYKWDDETLTLWRMPRFKVGDRIRPKYKKTPDTHTIRAIEGDSYCCGLEFIWIADQDDYELVSDTDKFDITTLKPFESKVLFPDTDKFDITTLKPFESKVLVWDDTLRKWISAFWGSKCDGGGYITTYGWCKYCIPFDGNEHLIGTSKDCDKFYKTWK